SSLLDLSGWERLVHLARSVSSPGRAGRSSGVSPPELATTLDSGFQILESTSPTSVAPTPGKDKSTEADQTKMAPLIKPCLLSVWIRWHVRPRFAFTAPDSRLLPHVCDKC